MTDIDQLKSFYESVGIQPEYYIDDLANKQVLKLEVDANPKIKGYIGFTTEIIFDMDGNFEQQNIWE